MNSFFRELKRTKVYLPKKSSRNRAGIYLGVLAVLTGGVPRPASGRQRRADTGCHNQGAAGSVPRAAQSTRPFRRLRKSSGRQSQVGLPDPLLGAAEPVPKQPELSGDFFQDRSAD